jgi:ATP-dependent Clp protease protease subunit
MMSSDTWFPEPLRPEPADPQAWMQRQLFDRRIVQLSGRLDDRSANDVGVALMTLDATGDQAVQLHIDSGEGTIDAALTLIDIIDLLGVPVHAYCRGQVAGPAIGVAAACAHRTASPHARLRLFEPEATVEGDARQLQQLASAQVERWAAYCARLARATGQPLERIADDAAAGRYFSADEAVAYGLLDEVATPDAKLYRLRGPSIGFGRR